MVTSLVTHHPRPHIINTYHSNSKYDQSKQEKCPLAHGGNTKYVANANAAIPHVVGGISRQDAYICSIWIDERTAATANSARLTATATAEAAAATAKGAAPAAAKTTIATCANATCEAKNN